MGRFVVDHQSPVDRHLAIVGEAGLGERLDAVPVQERKGQIRRIDDVDVRRLTVVCRVLRRRALACLTVAPRR